MTSKAADELANVSLDGRSRLADVIATIEEVQYAQALRARLREVMKDRPIPPAVPWCVSAD